MTENQLLSSHLQKKLNMCLSLLINCSVANKQVNYDDHDSLVSALQGQDVLMITLPVMAPIEVQKRLIDAALDADLKFIMPSEWGVDVAKEGIRTDTLIGKRLVTIREYIESDRGENKTAWIGLACGFWYEYSLAGTEARHGFDFSKKKITMFGDGKTRVNSSTWPQVGKAVARLMSLKILPEDEMDRAPCLSKWSNRSVYVSSFFVSRRDMLESICRVTEEVEQDWTIEYEDLVGRFERGKNLIAEGKQIGAAIMLYSRSFYPDGMCDFNEKLDNDFLGLSKESLDDATNVAIEMVRNGETNTLC